MEQTQLEINQLKKDIKQAKLQFESIQTLLPDLTQTTVQQSSLASTILNQPQKHISTKSDILYQQQMIMLDQISNMANTVSQIAKFMKKIDTRIDKLEHNQKQHIIIESQSQINNFGTQTNKLKPKTNEIKEINHEKNSDPIHLFEYFKDLPHNQKIPSAKKKPDELSERQKLAFKQYVKRRVYDLQDTDLV